MTGPSAPTASRRSGFRRRTSVIHTSIANAPSVRCVCVCVCVCVYVCTCDVSGPDVLASMAHTKPPSPRVIPGLRPIPPPPRCPGRHCNITPIHALQTHCGGGTGDTCSREPHTNARAAPASTGWLRRAFLRGFGDVQECTLPSRVCRTSVPVRSVCGSRTPQRTAASRRQLLQSTLI